MKRRRLIAIFCALAMIFMFASCKDTSSTTETNTDETKTTAPEKTDVVQETQETESMERKTLTFDVISYAENDPSSEEFEEALAEVTGYDLDINWIPTIGFADKINTLIAADSLSQMTCITQNRGSAFLNGAKTGMFWQLDDYVDQFENLSVLSPAVYDNVRIDGNLYGIPRERSLVRQGFIYRKDWAEEEGLSRPETVDEIINMIEVFAQREGVKYGLTSGYQSKDYLPEGLLYTAVYLGSPNNFGLDTDGNFTYAFTTPEYFEAVKIWNYFYTSGLLNKNYLELNQDDGKNISFINEETGFVFHYSDGVAGAYADLYVKNPDAQLWYGYASEGRDGVQRAMATKGFNGIIAFSKTANPEEEDILDCLSWVNAIATPEAATVFSWGAEGYTYEVADGAGTRTEEQYNTYMGGPLFYGQINAFGTSMMSSVVDSTLTELAISARDEKFEYYDIAVGDATVAIDSPTWTEIGTSDLTPIMSDTVNKYIQGLIDEDEYWAGVQEWLDAGGQTVIDEYAAAYGAN